MADKTPIKTEPKPQGLQSDGSFFFDLELVTIPVKLRKDGKNINCELRELLGDDRDKYLSVIAGKTKTNSEGKPQGIKNFDGIQSSVLKRALFNLDKDAFFTEAEINAFPNRVLDPMVDWVLETSRLGEEAEEKAKNETDGKTTNGDD